MGTEATNLHKQHKHTIKVCEQLAKFNIFGNHMKALCKKKINAKIIFHCKSARFKVKTWCSCPFNLTYLAMLM